MKLRLVFLLGLLLMGVILLRATWNAKASAEPGAGEAEDRQNGDGTSSPMVQLVSSSDTDVVFEVAVPWEQLSLELVSVDGAMYVKVSLPGWEANSIAGAPALPLLTEQIGVPFDVELSVRAEPGVAHTIELDEPVLPASTAEVEWGTKVGMYGDPNFPVLRYEIKPNLSIYHGKGSYPETLARINNDGVLRQQRLAGVVVFPVVYHPETKQLSVYESVRVAITFTGKPSEMRGAIPSDATVYENLYQDTLLNGKSAKDWRQEFDEPVIEGMAAGETTTWETPVPGWRVKVKEEGFYRLTYSELQAAGFLDENPNPQKIRLFHMGNEVAISVVGDDDEVFEAEEAIIFYGQPVSSKYTDENVYWLTYGTQNGLRMNTRDGTPGEAETPEAYTAQMHMVGNQFYLSLAPGDDELERWFWDYVYRPIKPNFTYTTTLAAPYTGTATLAVNMMGYYQDSSANPDHHANISLNGTQVGDVTWDGIAWKYVELEVSQGVLEAGDNVVSFDAVDDTDSTYDVFYIDWMELEYPNTFVAENDELAFSFSEAGEWKYRVEGFSSGQVRVYDVTDPYAVKTIENMSVVSSGAGYAAEFQDNITSETRYWSMDESTYGSVESIEEDMPSDLQNSTNGADYIVITHADFASAVSPLRVRRETQGQRAMLVDVQDVYDEFGYGIAGANAIHDFLAYTYYNWQAPAPAYVLLVGDGNYDPKDYKGYGRTSYIPPFLANVDPWIGETAADNRYVTLVGSDTLADMMLGRLAVNSSAEASVFVDKIIDYEEALAPGDWQKQVLLVADNGDAGIYRTSSDNLVSCCLPEPYQAEKVYLVDSPTNTEILEAREAIKTGINSGKLVVNYIGHGYTVGWAQEDLFTNAVVPTLLNENKYPIILGMTCRGGDFHIPQTMANYHKEALGEVVTRVDGKGAVASWAASGLGLASGHDDLNRGFFEAVFEDGMVMLGGATAAGKLRLWASGTALDLLDTFILFGDPAMRINLDPPSAASNLAASAVSTQQIDLSWEDNSNNESEFRIERSPDGLTGWAQVAVVGVGVTSYSDTGLSCETTYHYRVRAYRAEDGKFSDYSNIDSDTTFECYKVFLPVVVLSGNGEP